MSNTNADVAWPGRTGRLTDLRFLFRAVAILEAVYAIAGLMPPRLVAPATGWMLSADGHWITKLLALSLATQAWIAWILRDNPHLAVARGLAFYQLASATADWIMWLALGGDGIFATAQARVGVLAAIPSHYLLGVLLLVAARREART
jgi:hypothetical protein